MWAETVDLMEGWDKLFYLGFVFWLFYYFHEYYASGKV